MFYGDPSVMFRNRMRQRLGLPMANDEGDLGYGGGPMVGPNSPQGPYGGGHGSYGPGEGYSGGPMVGPNSPQGPYGGGTGSVPIETIPHGGTGNGGGVGAPNHFLPGGPSMFYPIGGPPAQPLPGQTPVGPPPQQNPFHDLFQKQRPNHNNFNRLGHRFGDF